MKEERLWKSVIMEELQEQQIMEEARGYGKKQDIMEEDRDNGRSNREPLKEVKN